MKYNINKNNLSKLFFYVKNELEINKKTIEELLKIDCKYCKLKIITRDLKDIVNRLQNETLDLKKEQNVIIHYNGNPYITLNLSLLAILTKTTIFLEFDENMLGINTFIIQTINNALKSFDTNELVFAMKKDTDKVQNIDKIICIDDINKYNMYLYKKDTRAKFYALNYMDFYSDSDEYEELRELIYKYTENNLIPIESYSEFEVDDAIKMLKIGLGVQIILITDNIETIQKFKTNISDKEIYINKNPFEKKVIVIDKEIFYI